MKKLKILFILSLVISVLSCNKENDDVNPENDQKNLSCDTTGFSYFVGQINSQDTCVVADGITTANGYGSAGSNSDGYIYFSTLTRSFITSSTDVVTKEIKLSKGYFTGEDADDFVNFFQKGKFGFSSEASSGYELSLGIQDNQKFSRFVTKGGAFDNDNFIEVTKVSSQQNFFTVIVVVEATVNAVLYDSDGNESYRIRDSKLKLVFQP